jgi:hypothetical protein
VDFSLGAQCFLADGRLILIGGSRQKGAIRLKETFLFDSLTEDWIRTSDLPERGPCTTLSETADGNVLAVGGAGNTAWHQYEKVSGWLTITAPDLDWPLYPQLTLLADGSVFYSGQHFGGRGLLGPGLLKPGGRFAELPEGTFPPNFLLDYRAQGGTLLLPPAQEQKAVVLGGGSAPEADVYLLDFSQRQPAFRRGQAMPFGRANFNAIILADRTVLVCGGIRSRGGATEDALEGLLFSPANGSWSAAGRAALGRREHWSAVLLPDGRVLTAGSTTLSGDAESRLELYHPPYLFRGDRPVIEQAPPEIRYGERFFIETADADIRWMSLVRPMAVSHGFDSGQRLVDLPFDSRRGGRLEASVPANPNLAPPGRYLLFLINHKGIPSHGHWIYLTLTPGTGSTGPGDYAESSTFDRTERYPAQAQPDWRRPGGGRKPAPLVGGGVVGSTEPGFPAPLVSLEETPDPPAVIDEPDAELQARLPLWERWHEGTDEWSEWEADFPEEPSIAWEDWREGPGATEPPGGYERPQGHGHTDRVSDSPFGDPEAGGRPSTSVVRGYKKWVPPALILGSAGALALSMSLEIGSAQTVAALVFLLFAPGMAFVGLCRPNSWDTQIALAIGLSVALETLLTVVLLYLEVWSADRTFVILLAVSVAGAVVQLIRAALVDVSAPKRLKTVREATA